MTICGEVLDPFTHGADDFCDETATHRVTVDGARQHHRAFDACERHAQHHADAARRAYKGDPRVTITVAPITTAAATTADA